MKHRIAVVGSGIAGLSAAYVLSKDPAIEVTLFEANSYFGGHTNTVDVQGMTNHGEQTCPVDTGFLVFNERTYPNLISLFKELDIPSAYSDMSFSVQSLTHLCQRLEWSGSSLNSLFAQRRNLLNFRFLKMLKDIFRFNALTTSLARTNLVDRLAIPLSQFLSEHRFDAYFIQGYLLPMIGCIWSCPTEQMLCFPVATLIRFCDNHGLLQISNRPRWLTVAGGANQYVKIITDKLEHKFLNTPVLNINRAQSFCTLTTKMGESHFDQLIMATHADQALSVLADATSQEKEVLSTFKFKDNLAVLHKDAKMLPVSKKAWAAWNFESASAIKLNQASNSSTSRNISQIEQADNPVCLHYYLNLLQPLPFNEPIIVSLNPVRTIEPHKIISTFNYAHPVFDLSTDHAQKMLPKLQGHLNTWYAGAWSGYGFHEDGHTSGVAAALGAMRAIRSKSPALTTAQELST
jgi:predicted NAD/FAD-binding protein